MPREESLLAGILAHNAGAVESVPDEGPCGSGEGRGAGPMNHPLLPNKPLQRTKACQLSVDGQRAGAARLMR
jgi:hypothetical protein